MKNLYLEEYITEEHMLNRLYPAIRENRMKLGRFRMTFWGKGRDEKIERLEYEGRCLEEQLKLILDIKKRK